MKTIDKNHTDLSSIDKVKQRFMHTKIKCVKYNYSLDSEVQSVGAFDGYLQLSKDGKFLNIYNKKNTRRPEYIYDPDHIAIEKKREEFRHSLVRDPKTNILVDENFKEGRDFVCKKSSSSTALDDI